MKIKKMCNKEFPTGSPQGKLAPSGRNALLEAFSKSGEAKSAGVY